MACLLDTNVLLRLASLEDPAHPMAVAAVGRLIDRGEGLHVCSQNLVELWNVATRPAERNGLGLKHEEAHRLIELYEEDFERLRDSDSVFEVWKELVSSYRVSGTMVHDARLVAFMKVNGLEAILTFNDRDFRRFEAEGISVWHPEGI